MADTDRTPDTRGRFETLLIGLIVVLTIGAFVYLSGQRQQVLRASPSGFDGLQLWLTSQGHSAQNFTGGWTIDRTTVGLLVVPVYDTALDQDRTKPKTKKELLFQQDENDLYSSSLQAKTRLAPTLVILPKWRSGMRLTGLGHPALLVENVGAEKVLHDVTTVDTGRLARIPRPFTDFAYRASDGSNLHARLYVAQVFEGKGCEPIIGKPGQMVLAQCPLVDANEDEEDSVLVLSDPDLLSNHGLRLGDNASIAREIIAGRAGERNIVLDYSSGVWLTDPFDTVQRDRTWADLLRFFEPPFLTLWLSAMLILALVLWRSGLRYGPVHAAQAKLGASKALAIRARARLLRLTNQDGALLSEYVAVRITATATGLFGPAHARHIGDEETLSRHIKRQKPELAAQFAALLSSIRSLPPQLRASEAIAYVDEFEEILEKIANDT